MTSAHSLQLLAKECVEIAHAAGREILAVYRREAIESVRKDDASPLTEADLRAHRTIMAGLCELAPDVPILSEEGAEIPYAERATWYRYWLVDPLDGTKEFLSRNGEFTVNIALIENTRPALGIVHVPAMSESYWALGCASNAPQAWKLAQGAAEPIHVRTPARSPPRVLASRSHRGDSLDAFLERLGAHELVSAGSALKFCRLAEGQADVYPRLGPTSEWDTAAGQAVVEGAGGSVVMLDGATLAYNTKPSLINPSFVAYADSSRDWLRLL
jgi:3'(2'), 5'-bisphosphate nucleotidase